MSARVVGPSFCAVFGPPVLLFLGLESPTLASTERSEGRVTADELADINTGHVDATPSHGASHSFITAVPSSRHSLNIHAYSDLPDQPMHVVLGS